jgi:hypothetical protein
MALSITPADKYPAPVIPVKGLDAGSKSVLSLIGDPA